MKKNVLKIIILMVLCIFFCSSTIFSNYILLGDMNEDGKITEEDVSVLKKYLIDIEGLNEKQKQKADMNQDSQITLTDYSLLKSVVLGYMEPPFLQEAIYDVELEKFNIKNNGVVWENNANGMTEAIRYAKENNYKEVRFPKGNYVIKAPNPIIIDTKDLIINFNDATVRMQDEPYHSHWCMIDLREPAENLSIKNGIIQGNRFSEKFDPNNPYNEGTIPFSIKAGNHISIENLMIQNSSGYGMTIDTGMNRTKKVEIWANEFESGSISDTGELKENSGTMRSKKMYPVRELGGEFEIGYTAGYQGYGSILHQEYKAYFFDKDKKFISMSSEKQYVKSSLPENCAYIKIVIPQTQIKDGSEGSAFITNAKTFRNSTIKNCTFDAHSAVGLAIGGGQNFVVENCNFTRNGINIEDRPSISAKVAIDIEDGWECMQNITLRKNQFSDNRYDFTSCAGSNLVLEENNFTNGCSVYARSTNYTIIKNHFKGPVEFGVSMGGKTSDNTYTDASIHTYYSRFGNDEQTLLLNMNKETFIDSSVYAQNIDSKKQNQLIKNSTFTTSNSKKTWLKGNYENCTFTQAAIYNSAFLKKCSIQNSNIYAQQVTKYEDCDFENSNMITNSAEEISISQSRLTNTPIEITTWANPCKLTIKNSNLKNTDTAKEILRLSAGKAKEVCLEQNTISSVDKVITFFDTTYTSPQGKLTLQDNSVYIPENSYVINGEKIKLGKYAIECRGNLLQTGKLLHPIYENSDNLTVVVDDTQTKEISFIEKNVWTIGESRVRLSAKQENEVPSFEASLQTSKQTISPNEEFEIIITIKNHQDIEKGLLAFMGQLAYDRKLIEIVKIEGCNNWDFDENSFNKSNLKFLIDTNNYRLKEETVLKIGFKVKENIAASDNTNIKITHILASNGFIDVASQYASIDIKISTEKEEEKDNLPDNDGDKDNSSNTIITEDISKNTIADIEKNEQDNQNTTAKLPLPKAGDQNYIGIVLMIVILFCIGFFFRMQKMKN